MSGWHCHLASYLWEPLGVERFWSTLYSQVRTASVFLGWLRHPLDLVQLSQRHAHLGNDTHGACGIEVGHGRWQRGLLLVHPAGTPRAPAELSCAKLQL